MWTMLQELMAMDILQVKSLNMKWLKKSQGKILRKFISDYLKNLA